MPQDIIYLDTVFEPHRVCALVLPIPGDRPIVNDVISVPSAPQINIIAKTAIQIVVSLAAIEDIITSMPVEPIFPVTAEQDIIAEIAAMELLIFFSSLACTRQRIDFSCRKFRPVIKFHKIQLRQGCIIPVFES